MARSLFLPIIIGALTLSAASSGYAEPGKEATRTAKRQAVGLDDVIGVATQEADGTIVLQLRAEGPDGAIGDGLSRYPPGDKDYAMVASHVGPIPKGGSVPVRPFDR